jgi:D-lactate dehydrogenase
MKIAVFSTKPYDQESLDRTNTELNSQLDFEYFDTRLTPQTAFLAQGCQAVCVFVNDQVDKKTLEILASQGVKLVTLRCTGFNNVDLVAAKQLGIKVTRVTYYSPYSVAEFTVGLMLMLNRKLYRAYNRVRDDNFSLDGLLGFDFYGKTVGIIGTGKIGRIVGEIMVGFGCHLLGYDKYENDDFKNLKNSSYVTLPELLNKSDVISLHCPLFPETKYLINPTTIAQMKPGAMLINTSRGALIDTKAAIEGIKAGQIGCLGIDVYEQEDELFFEDLSGTIIQDDVFQLLQSFPNVVITSHQAFFTREALTDISNATIENIMDFAAGKPLSHEVSAK